MKDESPTAQDASPLQAQREWQQQAEDNVIERLQNAGMLAPQGEVDKILMTVVNNLQVTNNIDLPRPVRTRVMLTSPLETFSVGNTIIVSRGLIDVLPDEACLAMVLSHELAHIVLGHNLGSRYAFNDRMLFSDESTYQNLGFRHVPEEEDRRRQEGHGSAEELALRSETGYGWIIPPPTDRKRTKPLRVADSPFGQQLYRWQGWNRTNGCADDDCAGPRSKQAGSDSCVAVGWTRQTERMG